MARIISKINPVIKLFSLETREDYGKYHVFTILKGPKYSVFQFEMGNDDVAISSFWPYLQISFGLNSLIGAFCYVDRFSFTFNILGRTWRND